LTGYLANRFLAPRKDDLATDQVPTSDAARVQLHQLTELAEQQRLALARLAQLIGED
jgi:hypothetical protein